MESLIAPSVINSYMSFKKDILMDVLNTERAPVTGTELFNTVRLVVAEIRYIMYENSKTF